MNLNVDNDDNFLSEINIVPLTDVMLVLLIIFMVTTPMIVLESFKINLPKATASTSEKGDGIVVTISQDGFLSVDGAQVSKDDFENMIAGKLSDANNKTVIIKGDETAEHGLIVFVLDKSKSAGADKLSIATLND